MKAIGLKKVAVTLKELQRLQHEINVFYEHHYELMVNKILQKRDYGDREVNYPSEFLHVVSVVRSAFDAIRDLDFSYEVDSKDLGLFSEILLFIGNHKQDIVSVLFAYYGIDAATFGHEALHAFSDLLDELAIETNGFTVPISIEESEFEEETIEFLEQFNEGTIGDIPLSIFMPLFGDAPIKGDLFNYQGMTYQVKEVNPLRNSVNLERIALPLIDKLKVINDELRSSTPA